MKQFLAFCFLVTLTSNHYLQLLYAINENIKKYKSIVSRLTSVTAINCYQCDSTNNPACKINDCLLFKLLSRLTILNI